MKIPFIINFKTQNSLDITPFEVARYLIKCVRLNFDDLSLDTEPTTPTDYYQIRKLPDTKQDSFLNAIRAQLDLLDIERNIDAFKEIKKIQSMAPPSFFELFNTIEFQYEKHSLVPARVRSYFPDTVADMLAHQVNGQSLNHNASPDSLYAKYRRATKNLICAEPMAHTMSELIQAQVELVFSEQSDTTKTRIHDFLNTAHNERFGQNLYYSNAQQKPTILDSFYSTLSQKIPSKLKESPHSWRNTLIIALSTSTEVLERELWQVFSEHHPSLAIQVEKQKIQALILPEQPTSSLIKPKERHKI